MEARDLVMAGQDGGVMMCVMGAVSWREKHTERFNELPIACLMLSREARC